MHPVGKRADFRPSSWETWSYSAHLPFCDENSVRLPGGFVKAYSRVKQISPATWPSMQYRKRYSPAGHAPQIMLS